MLGLFFGTTFPPAISRNALQAEEAVVTGPSWQAKQQCPVPSNQTTVLDRAFSLNPKLYISIQAQGPQHYTQ